MQDVRIWLQGIGIALQLHAHADAHSTLFHYVHDGMVGCVHVRVRAGQGMSRRKSMCAQAATGQSHNDGK